MMASSSAKPSPSKTSLISSSVASRPSELMNFSSFASAKVKKEKSAFTRGSKRMGYMLVLKGKGVGRQDRIWGRGEGEREGR